MKLGIRTFQLQKVVIGEIWLGQRNQIQFFPAEMVPRISWIFPQGYSVEKILIKDSPGRVEANYLFVPGKQMLLYLFL